MLLNHGTNKSRFIRLFLLCILWIFGNVPVQCYVFSVTFRVPKQPFDWNDIHDPEDWNRIIVIPSFGTVLYDRYIWLASGILMFVFFGFGTEALQMYRDSVKAIGLAKLFPQRWRQNGKQTSPWPTDSRDHILVQSGSTAEGTTSSSSMSTTLTSPRVATMNLTELEKGFKEVAT